MRNLSLRHMQRQSKSDLCSRIAEASEYAMAILPGCCSRGCYVYLVEGGGLIKIGFTEDPTSRMRDLQAGSPVSLRLLALGRGDGNIERLFHSTFSTSRRHGEWFAAATVLRWMRQQSEDRCVSCSLLGGALASGSHRAVGDFSDSCSSDIS